MSSPVENLKKVRKQPLLSTKRGAPYKQASLVDKNLAAASSRDTISLLSAHSRSTVTRSSSPSLLTDECRKQILEGIKEEGNHAPTDSDLVSSMAARLAVIEKELLAAKREIVEKVLSKFLSIAVYISSLLFRMHM